MGRIRYFFWSTALSGCLLIYAALTGGLKKTVGAFTSVRTQGAAGLPNGFKEKLPLFFHDYLPNVVKRKVPCHVWDNVDRLSQVDYYPDPAASSCTERGMPQPVLDASGAKDLDKADAASVSVDPSAPRRLTESAAATRSDIETGDYVEIDGKYYRRRADHIYTINNQKIYFVDNHRYVLTPDDENSANRITTVNNPTKVAARNVNSDTAPETPTTPAEMMQVLQKAQANQKDEEELLKRLDQEK